MKYTELKMAIPRKHRDNVERITRTFHEAGFECYMVGGAVRDLLLGIPVYDFDFATNAKPQDVTKLFRSVIPTGIKHGTVSVLIKKNSYEITTYRADGTYGDGRHPDSVSFSETLQDDIIRRDFTINGLALDIETDELIDYIDGVNDLRSGIIRTIGDPVARFREDGLRSYRACRFASKLHFEIEDATFDAMCETLDVSAKVSKERIRDEILKIMESEKPSVGLENLRACGLLAQALPELDAAYGVDQNKYHTYDVYYHCVYSCDAASQDDPLLRFAALLHDIGKVPCRGVGADGEYTFYNHEIVGTRMVKSLMRRLKFSNDDIARVTNLVTNHMFYYTPEWTDGAVRRFIRKVGLDNLPDLLALREADRAGNGSRRGQSQPVFELQRRIEKIIAQDNAFSVRDLEINGHDLMRLFGLKEGKMIGMVLNQLLEKVLDDPRMNTFETLRDEAEKIIMENTENS